MRIINIFFILTLLISVANLFSSPVDKQTARGVAEFHLRVNQMDAELSISNVTEIKNQKKQKLAYIFNLSPKGFVVISTDTDIYPVIAYSFVTGFPFIEVTTSKTYEIKIYEPNSSNHCSHHWFWPVFGIIVAFEQFCASGSTC